MDLGIVKGGLPCGYNAWLSGHKNSVALPGKKEKKRPFPIDMPALGGYNLLREYKRKEIMRREAAAWSGKSGADWPFGSWRPC